MLKTIQMSSSFDNLQKVDLLLDEICAQHHIPPDIYSNILVSLYEAVTNAVLHGNKMEESKNIELSFVFNPNNKLLIFEVKDEGNGFDYANLPNPTATENLEKIDGRGIFVMKQLANDVVFFNNGAAIKLHFSL